MKLRFGLAGESIDDDDDDGKEKDEILHIFKFLFSFKPIEKIVFFFLLACEFPLYLIDVNKLNEISIHFKMVSKKKKNIVTPQNNNKKIDEDDEEEEEEIQVKMNRSNFMSC